MSVVYIYQGEGAGELSLKMMHHCLSNILDPQHHQVTFITPQEIIAGGWQTNAAALCFGGGYDCGYIHALGQEGTSLIRDFVHQGGAYLGMCAGAYFACDYIEFDKGGPLEVVGERFLKFYPGSCIGPVFPGFKYGSEKGTHASLVKWTGPELSQSNTSADTEPFYCYFNGGGKFVQNTVNSSQDSDLIKVLGQYVMDSDSVAMVTCKSGEGMAGLSGVHLEFDPDLLPQDDPYLNQHDILAKLKSSNRARIEIIKSFLRLIGLLVT